MKTMEDVSAKFARLTKLFEHFIALVENKMFHVFRVQDLIPNKGVQSTGCGNNDMWAFALVPQIFSILGYRSAAIESADADIRHILGKSSVFVLDLESKFPCMTQDQNRDLAIDRFELLQSSEDENGGLSVARFRLAKHIHAQNSLWDTLLLDCFKKLESFKVLIAT